jgi:hypothetical protein
MAIMPELTPADLSTEELQRELEERRNPEEADCTCGIVGCKETGWPHEWNPIATGDDCSLCGTPLCPADEYRRYGSGYVHTTCAEVEIANA